jgi:hypothetical protein
LEDDSVYLRIDYESLQLEPGTYPSRFVARHQRLLGSRTSTGKGMPNKLKDTPSTNVINMGAFPQKEQTETVNTPSPDDADLLQLQTLYQGAINNLIPDNLFVNAIKEIDWTSKPSVLFEQAVDMALALDEITLARRLAQLGHDLYRSNTKLERVIRVLAPAKVVDMNRPPKEDLSASIEWLQHHANEHRGMWIAVLGGNLVGAASSRQDLLAKLDAEIPRSDVLITRIP